MPQPLKVTDTINTLEGAYKGVKMELQIEISGSVSEVVTMKWRASFEGRSATIDIIANETNEGDLYERLKEIVLEAKGYNQHPKLITLSEYD